MRAFSSSVSKAPKIQNRCPKTQNLVKNHPHLVTYNTKFYITCYSEHENIHVHGSSSKSFSFSFLIQFSLLST